MEMKQKLQKCGYHLGKTLGKGSYATVYQSFSEKLSRMVAMKVIDKQKCRPNYITKFLPRELSILTQCSHRNIIEVLDILESTHGKVFIIMEMAASDLFQKLSAVDYLSEKDSKDLFRQIVEGVRYCHHRGIAHRDLKCENILLTADNTPKLSDFGFATFRKGTDPLTSTSCGSCYYTAPEILQGESYDALKSDIWSLGVILYTMVTSYMPYDDYDLIKLSPPHHQSVEFPPSPPLTDQCRELISSILNMDPNGRPSAHQILQHPWMRN